MSRRYTPAAAITDVVGMLSLGVEPVADSANGVDAHARVDLLAHLRDVDVDGADVAEPVEAPHAVEDLLTAQRPTRAVGEEAEEVELLGRERDRLAVDADLAAPGVDGDVADLDDLGRAPPPPSARRRTAFTRATSSAGENGLVT